jgi:putative Mg2+ transporter-C (MgtC) family protein
VPDTLTLWELLIRLLAPAAFGAVLGWEREAREKPAGVRTHSMVGLGASSFALIGLSLFHELSYAGEAAGLDPIRVVQGVITGIGFLGAGSIIKSGDNSKGLTTAAAVWTCGGVGVACGAGYYAIAGATAAAAFLILVADRLAARLK